MTPHPAGVPGEASGGDGSARQKGHLQGETTGGASRGTEEARSRISLQVTEMGRKPPVRLLLTALGLSRKYAVEHMEGWLAKLLLAALTEDSFEEILAGAIRLDETATRMQCLRFAEKSSTLRGRYDRGEIVAPEVHSELRMLWDTPGGGSAKRRRVVVEDEDEED